MMNISGRLYRIMNFHHVVQLFEKNELFFASPSSWQDPYETRISHQESHKIFAQCWCSRGTSDAMWRIYSQDHLGIRISTSTKKLRKALDSARARSDFSYVARDVSYMSQFAINQEAKKIHSELKQSFSLSRATDMLFMKREAFDHEAEYRIVLTSPSAEAERVKDGFKITVDPKKFIDSILIDPRAPSELSDALIYYLKEKIGFRKRVSRSVLYKTPTQLRLEE